MGLREDFERTGNWLFKKRSFMPLFLLPLVFAAMTLSRDYPPAFSLEPWWKIFAATVSASGLIFRSWVIGQVPRGTSGRNTHGQVAETINTKGIYSIVRHPLYIGNFIMIFGIVLWTGVWWICLLFCFLFWIYYERIMFAEEEFLRKKFGQRYEDWSNRTPAFIPKFSQFEPADLEFSLKNVLKREYSGLFNMILSFVILEAYYAYVFPRVPEGINPVWLWTLAGTFAFSMLLRSLKKYTQILDVEGR